jgi:o-succinylbenzoate synthase
MWHLSYTHYDRSFKKPFQMGNMQLSKRTGLLLRLAEGDAIYYAEVAPLPGFSRETLPQCEYFLVTHFKNSANVFEQLIKYSEDDTVPPSIRIALGSLVGQRQNLYGSSKLKSNAMIGIMSESEALTKAKEYYDLGFRSFKFKCNPQNIHTLPTVIAALRKEFEEPVTIRLDSNQSLPWEECKKYLSFLDTLRIEYWEDPIVREECDALADWNKFSKIPLAIDEPLKNLAGLDNYLRGKTYDVYVLKPSMIGSLKQARNATGKILLAGKKFTITTALETEIGRKEVIRIASLLPSTPLAMGLATGDLFTENYLPDTPDASAAVTIGLQIWLNSLSWKQIT